MKPFNFLLLVIFFFPALLSAQSDKVTQAYSPAELEEMKKTNPDVIHYLNYKADHCYFVQDLSGKKDISDLPDVLHLNEIARINAPEMNETSFKEESFNPLFYSTAEKTPQYFRIGDSGILLKILAEEACRTAFKKQ